MKGIFDSPYVQQIGLTPHGMDKVILAAETKHTATNGFVHAGVLVTLLEMAAANIVEVLAVPSTVSINLIRPVKPPDLVIGSARIVNPGKRVVVVQSEIHDSKSNKLVAMAVINFTVIEEAKP